MLINDERESGYFCELDTFGLTSWLKHKILKEKREWTCVYLNGNIKKGLDYFFIPITYNIHVVINFFSETDRRRLKYIAYSLQEDLLIEKKYTHK